MVLNVRYDPTRPHDLGQYYIELVELDHGRPQESRRFGYWCDKGHLRTCAIAVVKEFGGELAQALLK